MQILSRLEIDKVFSFLEFDTTKLLIIFLVIVLALKFSKKLPVAIISGIISTLLLYKIGIPTALSLAGKAVIEKMTIYTVLAFYLITLLQRMLENRKDLVMAQNALNGIFNNRRINATLAPTFIGALPSAGAVTLCGAMVNEATENYLTTEEKAFVASYYRHIPESFLPTYTSIIIGVELSGVLLSSFLIGMIPMVVALFVLGYLFYLRKVPKNTGQPPSLNKLNDLKNLFKGLWTIIITIAIIMIFNLPAFSAVAIAIFLNFFVSKFKWTEIKPMFKSAFEANLIFSTIIIMIFKNILASTGAIERMPQVLSTLPIPAFLTFMFIFFFGTLISGQQAINVIALPIAFSTIAGGSTPLLVLLMCTGYSAMQISPTHICLAIVTEYFGIEMGQLVKKTLPVILSFLVVLTGYYLLLTNILK